MQLKHTHSKNTHLRSTYSRRSALLGILSFSTMLCHPLEAYCHPQTRTPPPLTGEENVTFTVTDGTRYCCSLASIAYGEVPLRAEHAAVQRFEAAHSSGPADASRHLDNAQTEENFLAALIESLEPEEAGWVLPRVQKGASARQRLRLPLDTLDAQKDQLEDSEYERWMKALSGQTVAGRAGAGLEPKRTAAKSLLGLAASL